MRGVNKLVMEVKSDGKYFDKALLFLKPEKANARQSDITDGAERLLKEINEQQQRKKNSPLLPAAIGCAAGTMITFISMLLLGAVNF